MIEGGCRCGAVRYACHCHVCQRWSGSAFSQQALIATTSLAITGPVEVYRHVTDDRMSVQRVCGVCHGRVYNTNSRRPHLAVLRAGTLDRSEELHCVAHIFTACRQRWVAIPADMPSWPEAPPPAEFVAMMTLAR